MTFRRTHSPRHARPPRAFHALAPSASARRRSLWAIPSLGVLVLILLWAVIFTRLSVERDSAQREAMASAAILSSALEQHTVKAIHQVDQITRFVKFEYEKAPDKFDLLGTVEKGVVQSDTLVQVSLIDENGLLIANTSRFTETTRTISSTSASQCSAGSQTSGRCK
jgi:hypothetical protein